MYEHIEIEELLEKVDHKSFIPLHIQVEQLLMNIIKLPDYVNGKLLPREVELAKNLGVSRSTIRQASNRLAEKNLIIRKKGVGTTVNKHTIITKLDSWSSFSKEMLEQGRALVNYKFDLRKVLSNKDVSFKLGIKESTEVYRLSRVRGNNNTPQVYFVSYFHPKVILKDEYDYSRPLYDIIEEKCGYYAEVSKEEISSILADQKRASKLNISIGSPILKRVRLVLDRGQSALEYNVGYYKAEDFIYSVELRR
jgi:GntR family transcriptional regulator